MVIALGLSRLLCLRLFVVVWWKTIKLYPVEKGQTGSCRCHFVASANWRSTKIIWLLVINWVSSLFYNWRLKTLCHLHNLVWVVGICRWRRMNYAKRNLCSRQIKRRCKRRWKAPWMLYLQDMCLHIHWHIRLEQTRWWAFQDTVGSRCGDGFPKLCLIHPKIMCSDLL